MGAIKTRFSPLDTRLLVTLTLALSLPAILLGSSAIAQNSTPKKRMTEVSISGDMFLINGKPTYAGRYWNGLKIEGLLMNSRNVQGTFDDLNPETRAQFAYRDSQTYDADRNTREFVAAMRQWREHGLLSFTLNLQGGNPRGYVQDQPWHNSAFTETGELRPEYLRRFELILDKADELGMVPILGLYYFGQDQRLKDEAAIIKGVDNAIHWLFDQGYRHVLIEINNECNVKKYDHEILKPDRVHELIERVRSKTRDGKRFLVSTSYGGGAVPKENVVRSADFLLVHGNGQHQPEKITDQVKATRLVPGYRPMPIVNNEDDHFDFDKPRYNFLAALEQYCSWGYFDYRMQDESLEDGYQSPPVSWGITSPRKKAFFAKLQEITGGL